MKRFILIMLCFLTVSLGSKAADGDSIDVSTAKEFINALKANRKYIHLVADIDMNDFDSSVDDFSGEINGSDYVNSEIVNHTISNLHETLVVSMSGANIHNIKLLDCEPCWHWYSINEGVGIICRNSKRCQFWNIKIDNAKVAYSGFWKGLFINPIRHYNGGLVTGKDEYSDFDNIYVTNSYVYVSSTEGGGIVGDSEHSKFKNIIMEMSTAVHVEGGDNLADANAGGIAGRASGSTFTGCSNSAMVTAALDNVGGIAGEATDDCTFTNCNNYAYIGHQSIGDAADMSSTIASYSCLAVVSNVASASANAAVEASNTAIEAHNAAISAAMKSYEANMATYRTQLGEWEIDMRDCQRILSKMQTDLGNAKSDIMKSYIKGWVDKYETQLKGIEARKPAMPSNYSGEAEQPTTELKGSSSVSLLSYILTALQIAQMVYEAQDEDNVGGIVGLMDGGSITACANYGMIHCDDAYSGGIAGETSDVAINSCHNAGTVTGYEQTGGIVGLISGGSVSNSLNTGNINSGNSGKSTFGQIYGEKSSGAVISNNCYSSNVADAEGTACRRVSQQMLISGELAKYLNTKSGKNYWRQTIGEDFYPSLDTLRNEVKADTQINTTLSPVLHVSSALELMEACSNQYAQIELSNDIEVNSSIFALSSKYMPFYGSIDGKGHTISNIDYTVASYRSDLFKNDNHESRVALFPFARNATFKNLTLENINVNINTGAPEYASLLVADSKGCTYENVNITGASTIYGGNADNLAGLVALSDGDTFTDCSIGASCKFSNNSGKLGTFYTRPTGGFAAYSKGSTFTRCFNAGTVYGKDTDYAGGIIARDEGGSKVVSCLNTGSITAEEYVGGLVGYGKGSDISNCVNTGVVTSTDTENNAGGLAGELKGGKLKFCFNYGDIVTTGSSNNGGVLIGVETDVYTSANMYYCNSNGSAATNIEDSRLTDIKSGYLTYGYLNTNTGAAWYQAIDDNYSFPTHYPVPIPAAGTVYMDYLCDGSNTKTYSNRYHAESGHTQTTSSLGICTLCGYLASAPESGAEVEIADANDLMDFALLTRKSSSFSTVSAKLAADIDLDGCDFPTIGNDDLPYMGTFNGQEHRIKNMKLTVGAGHAGGFFTCLGEGAVVENLIIDASCSISGDGTGVAGIAGRTKTDKAVNITNCGNEANVTTSQSNAAGILGGVYNYATTLTISNCYNAGTIKGAKESAAICAWAKDTYKISNCYNSGSVSGIESGKAFYRANNYGTATASATNCYDANGTQTGVTKATSDEITSGELCWKLNGQPTTVSTLAQNGFYQCLDNESYPTVKSDENGLVTVYNLQKCDETTTKYYYNYGNNTKDLTATVHDFDDNGFCKLNAAHYEEPDTIHSGNTIIYQLKNAGNLYWISEQVNNGESHPNCILMNDIVVNSDMSTAANSTNTLRAWTPIGNESYPYQSATFDGNGHTISGLYYNNNSTNCVGLFGLAYNSAVIKNLGVTDCYFVGGNGVGAIIGWGGKSYTKGSLWTDTTGPSLFNCFSTGTVNGTDYAGGLMGFANNGNLTSSRISTLYSNATVNTSGTNCGALFGYLGTSTASTAYSGTLNNCYYYAGNIINTNKNSYGAGMSQAEFAKGVVCDKLNHSELTDDVKWTQDIAKQSIPVFGDDGIVLTRTVANTDEWGTLIVPFTVYSDSTVTYFQMKRISAPASGVANLYVEQVDQVQANTPCFFRINTETTDVCFRSEGREITIPTYSNGTCIPDNPQIDATFEVTYNGAIQNVKFTGSYSEPTTTLANYGFILGNGAMWNVPEVWESNDSKPTIYVEPYHAYLNNEDVSSGNADDSFLSSIEQLNIMIEGSDYDVNQDGSFDETDVTDLYNVLTGKTQSDNTYDINQDEKFTMSDLTYLINKLRTPDTISINAPTSDNAKICGK